MLCIKLVNYYDYTEMHGQRNIKKKSFGGTFFPLDETRLIF